MNEKSAKNFKKFYQLKILSEKIFKLLGYNRSRGIARSQISV